MAAVGRAISKLWLILGVMGGIAPIVPARADSVPFWGAKSSVPIEKGVQYIVYGDCTSAQLSRNYGGKQLGPPGSWICARIRRLRDHGCIFLCMSHWYRNALRDEYDIPENQLVFLPFYVDTDKWKPLANKPVNARKQALFIGAHLERKGADIVYELARRERFKSVDFHIVSPNAEPGPENLHPHRGLAAECPELIRLTAECDLFLLPTRADTSSIAALEAAACGLPAIITGRGGIGEIVLDGVTGTVLPEPDFDSFESALATYLENPALVAARGRDARRHVERHYSKTRHMEILRGAIARAAATAARTSGDARRGLAPNADDRILSGQI